MHLLLFFNFLNFMQIFLDLAWSLVQSNRKHPTSTTANFTYSCPSSFFLLGTSFFTVNPRSSQDTLNLFSPEWDFFFISSPFLLPIDLPVSLHPFFLSFDLLIYFNLFPSIHRVESFLAMMFTCYFVYRSGHSLILFFLALPVLSTMLCVCSPDTLGDARQTMHARKAD